MSFEYTPITGLRDKVVFPKIPLNEDDARNQFMILFDQIKDKFNNTDLQLLEDETDLIARGINVKNPPVPLVAAQGDGVTNDATAIQAILNYANSNNKGNVIFFPPGTYIVNSTLTIYSYQKIVGSGLHTKGTIIKKGSSFPAGQPMIKNENYANSNGNAYIQFENIELNGNLDKASGSNLIDIKYCWWFTLKDVRLRDSYKGLRAESGTQLQIAGQTTITGNEIGIELVEQEFRADKATIEFNNTGITISNVSTYEKTVNIEGCYLEVDNGDIAGIVIKSGTRRVNVKGTYIYSHTEYGDCVIIEAGSNLNVIKDNNIIGNISVTGFNNELSNNGAKSRLVNNNFNFTEEILTDVANNLLPNPYFTSSLDPFANWNTETYSGASFSVQTNGGYASKTGGRLKCTIAQASTGILKRVMTVTQNTNLFVRVDIPVVIPKCSVSIGFYSVTNSKYYNFTTQTFTSNSAIYVDLKPGQNRLSIPTGTNDQIQIRISIGGYNIVGNSGTQELLFVYAGHTRDIEIK